MNKAAQDLPREMLRELVEAIQDSEGVDYSPRMGGVCPVCGAARCRVTNTGAWTGQVRMRNHRCRICGLRFKSVEVDG
ncbi:hypothetical protein [Pseudodesulfovibrio pelocollis]|uniref:hypothetical protein n=1 Tax=Pseudodesulfovibrio pelocollis TaxID=3051432 RepID=UPI00255AA082|nr:hypothetical protein [Pseudodesulfovibrio sp. SB368]